MADFYVLEGLDGVGKSSVAEELAERQDAVYLRCPPEDLDPIRGWVDSDETSIETKFLLYLGGNSAVSDDVRRELEVGNDVVLDRYYPTTVAYHNVEADRDLAPLVDEFDLVEPDDIFYLSADTEVREQRMSSRENLTRNEDDSDFMSEVEEEYEELIGKFDMVEIEAVDGVGNVVDSILEEAQRG